MATPEVKICGLVRREDAALAATAGARYGGVILAPGGKRSVAPEAAVALFAGLGLRRVGVFVDASAETLRRVAEQVELDVVQLHGSESPAVVRALRAEGRWRIWKAVRPRGGGEFVEALERYGSLVDGLLLDGWSPGAPGGTGSRFPWEAVAAYREQVPAEVALVVAGGLNPANVRSAIALLRPAVVDVSSGVEASPGVKDPAMVPAFVSAALLAADDSIQHP